MLSNDQKEGRPMKCISRLRDWFLDYFFGISPVFHVISSDNVDKKSLHEGLNGSFCDSPITSMESDLFGNADFAKAFSRTIQELSASDGAVIALSGQWGSGKTSILNMALEHLSSQSELSQTKIVHFEPWAISGSDAIILGFLQTIYGALDKGAAAKAREGLVRVGRRVLPHLDRATPLADIAATGFGAPIGIATPLASAGSSWLASALRESRAEEELKRLREILRKESRRYLVVIDDLDRLFPDELLSILRMIKSVGKLPNVVYIIILNISFIDNVLEKSGFNDKNVKFTEKIIQYVFDVPEPEKHKMRNLFLHQIESICGRPRDDEESIALFNMYFDCVAPWLRTPRDYVRLLNGVSITFPSVRGEVAVSDFIALEAMKLFLPDVYRAIRTNKEILCNIPPNFDKKSLEERKKKYDIALSIPNDEIEGRRAREALQRLFPTLKGAWGNTTYNSSFTDKWRAERRVCTLEHFETYFRLYLSQDALPQNEVTSLLNNLNDANFIRNAFESSLLRKTLDGRTHVSLLLEELMAQSSAITDSDVPTLISTLFTMADDLHIESDEDKHTMALTNNKLRLHRITNKLVRDRFDIETSSSILKTAISTASLGWAAYIARRIHEHNSSPEPSKDRSLVTTKAADEIVRIVKDRIENEAVNEKLALLSARWLGSTLFSWSAFCNSDEYPVKEWTSRMLSKDDFVITIAETMMFRRFSQSDGDRAASITYRVRLQDWEGLIDSSLLLDRVNALRASPQIKEAAREILEAFVSAAATAEN